MLFNKSIYEPEYFCDDWGFYVDIEIYTPIQKINKSKKFLSYFQTIHEDNEYYTNIEIKKMDTKKNNTSLLTKISSTTFITAAITYFVFCVL